MKKNALLLATRDFAVCAFTAIAFCILLISFGCMNERPERVSEDTGNVNIALQNMIISHGIYPHTKITITRKDTDIIVNGTKMTVANGEEIDTIYY